MWGEISAYGGAAFGRDPALIPRLAPAERGLDDINFRRDDDNLT
jgi:hypothetical protein